MGLMKLRLYYVLDIREQAQNRLCQNGNRDPAATTGGSLPISLRDV